MRTTTLLLAMSLIIGATPVAADDFYRIDAWVILTPPHDGKTADLKASPYLWPILEPFDTARGCQLAIYAYREKTKQEGNDLSRQLWKAAICHPANDIYRRRPR